MPNNQTAMKYFQIAELDLATLEAELPALLDGVYPSCNDPVTRKRRLEVKSILSNVRWNYGPPSDVTTTPADDI